MNGRIYDPLLGRFLSADLVVQNPADLQAFNRYSYVLNRPLTMTDPTGFFWQELLDRANAATGYAFGGRIDGAQIVPKDGSTVNASKPAAPQASSGNPYQMPTEQPLVQDLNKVSDEEWAAIWADVAARQAAQQAESHGNGGLSTGQRIWAGIGGVLNGLGSAASFVAAAATAETVGGAVGFTLLGGKLADSAWTDAKTAWTGRRQDTAFSQALQWGGASQGVANMASWSIDGAAGILTGRSLLGLNGALAAESAGVRSVIYVTPMGVAISSDTLALQGTSRLAGNFQGLAGATVDDVVARIPANWTCASQLRGQGIVWRDALGFERIRIHGPSLRAPVGSNSAAGWVLRVSDRAGNYFDDLGRMVPYRANEGHIPLFGNPTAP